MTRSPAPPCWWKPWLAPILAAREWWHRPRPVTCLYSPSRAAWIRLRGRRHPDPWETS